MVARPTAKDAVLIEVAGLGKVYPVAVREPGLAATVKHFFRRKTTMVNAVTDVSFRIEPGQRVGFLGPNGAGKTTTLKMLTGLIRPSTGQVRVAGHDPFRRERAFLERITLVMGQKQQLIWDLPAAETLRINAAVYGISDADLRTRVGELREMLGLDEQLGKPVRKLSLGERMKAELLAALLHRPQVLFLDEPTLGLDVNAQAAVRRFLREYNERYGATILLTSHYMADITALSERVLLIHRGKLIYDGDLPSLTDRFAPHRLVRVELQHPQEAAALARFGHVESVEGHIVCYTVERAALTSTVSRILAELEVADLEVTDPPIEEVIGRAFAGGSVETPAA